MSENGGIYTAGKNFTLPPALTGWTNSNSACHVIFMFMFYDYDDFDNVNVVAVVMQIIFEAGIMMTIKITIQC